QSGFRKMTVRPYLKIEKGQLASTSCTIKELLKEYNENICQETNYDMFRTLLRFKTFDKNCVSFYVVMLQYCFSLLFVD
ncbi:Hypothetical predicted protein, partial [Mytilus galloprovincialis]